MTRTGHAPSDPPPGALQPARLRRRVVQLVVVVAVAGVAVATLPGLGEVRERLAHAHPSWLLVALAAELASAASYVVALRVVFCPCMRWWPSVKLGMSELAAGSLLPAGGAGGLALGAWALHRGGMSSAHIARRTVTFFLLTSAANFAVVMVAGIGVALGLLPGTAALVLTIVPAALAAAVVLVVLALPRVLGRVLSTRAGATVAQGVRDLLTLLSSGRLAAVLGSLGYLVFDIATMAACFQATGSVPPLGDFVLAYTIGQLGGLIPIPGGMGATDGGLIGTLVLYGAPLGPVTAAVLVYRLVQLGVPALLGTPAFLLLHRSLRRRDAFATICEPLAEGSTAAA